MCVQVIIVIIFLLSFCQEPRTTTITTAATTTTTQCLWSCWWWRSCWNKVAVREKHLDWQAKPLCCSFFSRQQTYISTHTKTSCPQVIFLPFSPAPTLPRHHSHLSSHCHHHHHHLHIPNSFSHSICVTPVVTSNLSCTEKMWYTASCFLEKFTLY